MMGSLYQNRYILSFPRVFVGVRLLCPRQAIPGDAIHPTVLGETLDPLEIPDRLLGYGAVYPIDGQKLGVLAV